MPVLLSLLSSKWCSSPCYTVIFFHCFCAWKIYFMHLLSLQCKTPLHHNLRVERAESFILVFLEASLRSATRHLVAEWALNQHSSDKKKVLPIINTSLFYTNAIKIGRSTNPISNSAQNKRWCTEWRVKGRHLATLKQAFHLCALPMGQSKIIFVLTMTWLLVSTSKP